MNKLSFVKMHGIGNDFVLIDARKFQDSLPWSEIAGKILDRQFGIGADSLLVLEPSERANCKMRIFERDGIESENCGNGLRCVAKYIRDQDECDLSMKVETLAGIIRILEVSRDRYRVQMSKPQFAAHEIGVTQDPAPWGSDFSLGGKTFRLYTVGMGNPHTVIYVDRREDLAFVKTFGPLLENNPLFVNRTNVNFVYRASSAVMVVRTWERSAGNTLACGTGACAVGVVSIRLGLSRSPVLIQFERGELEIEWKENEEVWMTGPATYVYRGEYEL